GTPDFLAMDAVVDGLNFLSEIGISAIQEHVAALAEHLLRALRALRYPEGAPVVRLYGPEDMQHRGATVAFNLLDARGAIVDHSVVVSAAATAGISLRGGCFCNPGATEAAFGYDPERLRDCLEQT